MKRLNPKQNVLFLAGLLAFSACHKKDKDLILVEGQVFDAITQQPIPDATVEVRSKEQILCIVCFGSGNYKTIESEKKANATGYFGFSFEGQKKTRYALGGRAESHFFHEDSSFVRLEKGKNNQNLKLFLTPYAWVKIHIKNEFPIDTADIQIDYFWNFNGLALNNFSGDSVLFIKRENPGKVQVRYSFEKNYQYTQFADSVAFINGDTILLEIKY